MTDIQRERFEAAVIERMKEGGFLEVEIRVECLARCEDGYQDEVINAGWHYWNAAQDNAIVHKPRSVGFSALAQNPVPQLDSETIYFGFDLGVEAPPVEAVIAFYPSETEPRLISWNEMPAGEHKLYAYPAPSRSSRWDALAEFKRSAAAAREAFDHVVGKEPRMRAVTVGKHQARNHAHLKSIYEEAFNKHPEFADTLAWLLWWEILEFDRLALLTEEFTAGSAPREEA